MTRSKNTSLDVVIQLSRVVFELLAERSGDVVSRQQLLLISSGHEARWSRQYA